MNPSRFDQKDSFVAALHLMCTDVHATNVEHGFFEGTNPKNHNEIGHRLLLVTTEVAECFEGIRKGLGNDEHCPEFSNEEIEIADAMIRLMDYASWRGLRLGRAIVAKARFNEGRPYKHGKKF